MYFLIDFFCSSLSPSELIIRLWAIYHWYKKSFVHFHCVGGVNVNCLVSWVFSIITRYCFYYLMRLEIFYCCSRWFIFSFSFLLAFCVLFPRWLNRIVGIDVGRWLESCRIWHNIFLINCIWWGVVSGKRGIKFH